MEEMRKQFEAVWSRDFSQYTDDDELKNFVFGYWQQAWVASRAALVADLPEPHAHLIWVRAGYAPDYYWG